MRLAAVEAFAAMSPDQRAAALRTLTEAERVEVAVGFDMLSRYYDRTKIERMYPDEGPFARELYPKHIETFELGAEYQFRALLGGNGIGKTTCAGAETYYHASGRYPRWWPGWRYPRPISGWVAGDTTETVRDILQTALMGHGEDYGTGIIPASDIVKVKKRQNGNGALDEVHVRHVSGRVSVIGFKSYDQGRRSFQGTNKDWIWLDEECPMDVYQECVHRFRGETADGRLLLTFTPLKGVTDLVKMFVPQFAGGSEEDEDGESDEPVEVLAEARKQAASRTFVLCGWEDVPHLSEREKNRKLANTLPFEREARMRGVPTVGRGRIFMLEEDAFVVTPFAIPDSWPRIYGADFGFGKKENDSGTAAVWIAWDRSSDTAYIYDEYKRAEAVPAVHASAIRGRGAWIPGVGDYAGRDLEGRKTIELYTDLGLNLENANKEVYASLQMITQMLNEGRIRVFRSCQKWLQEYRLYSFDEDNKVIKVRDHLMDATRYALMADRRRAITKPHPEGAVRVAPQTFGLYRGN